jgi:hypothetical protein
MIVNKNDFEITKFQAGYCGITKKTNESYCVFGGDSANEDDYNLEYINEVFEKWDGVLEDDGYGKYRINN